MNRFYSLLFVFTILLSVSNCDTPKQAASISVYQDSIHIHSPYKMSINLIKGRSFNHPTYVIWEENMQGDYIKTIFITKSYASGVFGHQMIKNSIWLNQAGSSFQPAALPYWSFKKGLIDNQYVVPTPEHPFIDAFTCATPQQDFRFESGTLFKEKQHRILLEVNQAWDWNKYWTNNKYPGSYAYKHSAQPSLVYAVVVNTLDNTFSLNPIGHGDPRGESGKLFTDLTTLTTAIEIFKSIEIHITK
ncbi:MAG: hypothetical protein H8E61_10285 [Bacteroidetes bacterium]|nr:hypothetical protein [Bacteroidota bacterium]